MTTPSNSFSVGGLVCLVTGSSRGIGEAIARRLAAEGAHVIAHARDQDHADALALDIGGVGVAGDLRQPETVGRIRAAIETGPGRLDVLVNNAGVEHNATIDALNRDVLTDTFEINLAAPIQLIRELLPLLRSSPAASIINVSSIHEFVPSYGNIAYAASKAALRMATQTLAVELGPEGIRVNSVAPGAIATDINQHILEEIGIENFNSWIPLGRVGTTADVAEPVVFLASSAARYITGASLVIDGGYSNHLVRYRATEHE